MPPELPALEGMPGGLLPGLPLQLSRAVPGRQEPPAMDELARGEEASAVSERSHREDEILEAVYVGRSRSGRGSAAHKPALVALLPENGPDRLPGRPDRRLRCCLEGMRTA